MYSRKGMNPNEYRTDDAEEVLVLRAEIERLRSLVESYRVNFENEVIVRRQTQIESEELRAEIERLRTALKGVNND